MDKNLYTAAKARLEKLLIDRGVPEGGKFQVFNNGRAMTYYRNYRSSSDGTWDAKGMTEVADDIEAGGFIG